MRTDRSYRRALSFDVALAEMDGNAGSQFDPSVIATLLDVVSREETVQPVESGLLRDAGRAEASAGADKPLGSPSPASLAG